MYENILVPMALDHGISEASMKVARALLSDGGRITALHVYEAPQSSVNAYLDKDVVQKAYERAKQKLNSRVESQPDVEAVIVAGHSGRGIVDYASEIAADCIVLGSHKPGLADFFLGSTAARVVRHATCAVHVLRDQG